MPFQGDAMFNNLVHAPDCTSLSDKIRTSATVTPALMSEFAGIACKRVAKLNKGGQPAFRIGALLQNSAWLEAAITLVEIELPGWTLRRLVQDDGVWICSLSRQPLLPIELDDTADGAHECMPLAVLAAILQAQMRADPASAATTTTARQAMPVVVMCCDNFV
jgi:hypothetical protein